MQSEKIFSDSHSWATLLQNDTQQLMANEKKNNRKAHKRSVQQAAVLKTVQQVDGEESDVGIIYESDSPLNQSVTESVTEKPLLPASNGLQVNYYFFFSLYYYIYIFFVWF